MEKRLSRWEGFADRMEHKADVRFLPSEDGTSVAAISERPAIEVAVSR